MSENFVQSGSDREWWSQRWLDALASFGRTLRSARAHTYARQGNVLSIEFRVAKVTALVQGTAPEPYKVSISLEAFSDEDWDHVIDSMAQQAVYAAKLLAGEMPQTIEDVFTANGLSLFPLTRADIRSRCNCPDPANPCKHIGAVYYTLGDRFGEDPFVLFQLRGRSREQIINALRLKRGDIVEADLPVVETPKTSPGLSSAVPSLNLDRFWDYDAQLEPSLVVIAPPPSSETVLDVLGPIPLKTDAQNATQAQSSVAQTMETLKSLYREVSQQAVLAAMTAE